MKRKLLAFLLAVTMLLALALPASADTPLEAAATSQSVYVNGQLVETEIYNIDGYNYFKLRDIAMMLVGTQAQFAVEYDEAAQTVRVTTGSEYAPVGGELEVGTDKSGTCVEASQSVEVDGRALDAAVYNLGGNVFFKLRDLSGALGFELTYDEDSSSMLISAESVEEYLFRCVDPTPQKADIYVTPLAERIEDFAGKTIAVCSTHMGHIYDYPEGICLLLKEKLPDTTIIYVSEMPVAAGQSTDPRHLEGVENMTFAEFVEDPTIADGVILLHGH